MKMGQGILAREGRVDHLQIAEDVPRLADKLPSKEGWRLPAYALALFSPGIHHIDLKWVPVGIFQAIAQV